MDTLMDSTCASLFSWSQALSECQALETAKLNWSLVHSSLYWAYEGWVHVPFIFEDRKQHWITVMFMFLITRCPWESEGTVLCFFLFFRTEQNCRDKQTLPCKVKTQHLRCVLKYWFSLAAIGRRSKADGAMCAGPRVLGEIQAALCTPREWGLAYIECLCCRIESVEHLCLSSLTVKLGLTKNPSYTNRKWSSPPPPSFLFCMKPFHVAVFVKYIFFYWKVCLIYSKIYVWNRWKKRGNTGQ